MFINQCHRLHLPRTNCYWIYNFLQVKLFYVITYMKLLNTGYCMFRMNWSKLFKCREKLQLQLTSKGQYTSCILARHMRLPGLYKVFRGLDAGDHTFLKASFFPQEGGSISCSSCWFTFSQSPMSVMSWLEGRQVNGELTLNLNGLFYYKLQLENLPWKQTF